MNTVTYGLFTLTIRYRPYRTRYLRESIIRHNPDWKTTSEKVPYQNHSPPRLRTNPASMHMHIPAPVSSKPATARDNHLIFEP